jgi:hypothetical protein
VSVTPNYFCWFFAVELGDEVTDLKFHRLVIEEQRGEIYPPSRVTQQPVRSAPASHAG